MRHYPSRMVHPPITEGEWREIKRERSNEPWEPSQEYIYDIFAEAIWNAYVRLRNEDAIAPKEVHFGAPTAHEKRALLLHYGQTVIRLALEVGRG